MNINFLFIGGPEIFIIILIIVMFFGADKLPEIARGLGKGMRQIKDATNDIKREINNSVQEHGIDTNIVQDIHEEVKDIRNDINDNIDDLTGPIKRKK